MTQDYDLQDSYSDNDDLAEESQGTWSSEFDDFSRITQKQSINANERELAKVFSAEQLSMYDRNQFSELHFNLQAALKRDPQNMNVLIGIAVCDLAISEPQKAAEIFAKVADIDDNYRPSILLTELAADPDDLLDMAEEMGHCGIVDVAVDFCNKIVDSNEFSDNVRRQAMKMREAIKQDFFAARERIAIGTNPKKEKNWRNAKLTSAFTFIFLPLLLAVCLAGFLFYTIQMDNGKKFLSVGIYRVEHLKRGDTAVERMGAADSKIYDAIESFENAKSFNPFTKEAYFYEMQAYNLLRDLGHVRAKDPDTKWDADQWSSVKDGCQTSTEAYNNLGLSTDKDLAFKEEWQEFYKTSKVDNGLNP